MLNTSSSFLLSMTNDFVTTGLLLGHSYYSSAPQILLKNPKTGMIKKLPVGWNWWGFLSPYFLGIPFFLQRLYISGSLLLIFGIFMSYIKALMIEYEYDVEEPAYVVAAGVFVVINLVLFILQIYCGSKGSKMIAKNYLMKGWVLLNPESELATHVRQKWNLA